MPVPVTQVHILRLVMQIDTTLSNMQRSMRQNATTWKAQAQAQSVPRATLAQRMIDAGNSYLTLLNNITTLQANTTIWNRTRDMYVNNLGGLASDFSNFMTPLNTVATGLVNDDKSSYALIVTGCNQILSFIDAPPNLWPE